MPANYEWHGEEAKKSIRQLLINWLDRSTQTIVDKAKQLAPVSEGRLRSSLGKYVDKDNLMGYAGIMQAISTQAQLAKHGGKMADYALWIEMGTPRHFAPYHKWGTGEETPLARWARRHGFKVPERGGGLLVWGYNIPFMSKALDTAQSQIVSELERLRDKI
jgi:hypothetical protein